MQAALREAHFPGAKRLTSLTVTSTVLREVDVSSCAALQVGCC